MPSAFVQPADSTPAHLWRGLAKNSVAHRNKIPHLRKNYYIFPYFRGRKIGIMFYKVSTSMKKIAKKKYKQTNKLTSACNPRANGSSVLADQNARFAKAML